MAERRYFFCGIGGSGMLPLARFLHAGGAAVEGSDRAFDQGRAPEVEKRLNEAGITTYKQDGSGIRSEDQILVTSSAVEAIIPDVEAARAMGLRHMIRAELLAETCNAATVSCGIAGTSGKSTTTAMLAHILTKAGCAPSVVNGAPMLNNLDTEGRASAWQRGEGPFICEVDESDGSIARYDPSVGVVLNVSEDHKPMAELKELFGGFAERSGKVVLGIDSEPVRVIAKALPPGKAVTVSLEGEADIFARNVARTAGGLEADIVAGEETSALRMPLIGAFNVGNALAAIAAARELGVSVAEACEALSDFRGSARRLQQIGEAKGVTVIDDFAHNPDKIAASIRALTHHFGQLDIYYQPHGYGPLKSFRSLYEEAFASALRSEDRLTVSRPAFFGGTVTKTDDAERMVEAIAAAGRDAHYTEERSGFTPRGGAGSALVVMGARDDSLTVFAHELLARVEQG
ncbi:UDP-N-acetylmuramate--alanine ligase [Parvularcula sp. ZS-1/3]|uniref:UDP-N-acetylmuramate--alanine ligase n=1 Tax=Parvularcula mediterranea TaxID=2732508 RepID=A0A7Y3RLA1_9PROT|nr:Mur ligase family protein [Parvularcula mediterranea]NNU15611.1 UDP-N-acetylmuramate--alanine ligase [Parvularcula mediterranea]